MIKKLLKGGIVIFTLVLLAGMTLTVGCNTIHGVGEDVEEVGDAIEDAAD